MSKKNCDLVKDLLPLYAENMCSEESCKTVTAHLAECAECSRELDKMKSEVRIKADNDIAVLKKIRRKLRMTRLLAGIAAALAVLYLAWLAVFHLLNTPVEMNYDLYGFADSITVEQDENGDLWLVRRSLATTAPGVELTTKDGTVSCTLMQRMIDRFAYIDMSGDYTERILLGNASADDLHAVYYCELKTGEQHELWKEGE